MRRAAIAIAIAMAVPPPPLLTWRWDRQAGAGTLLFPPGMRRSSRAPRPSGPSAVPLPPCPQGHLTERGCRRYRGFGGKAGA